MTSTHTQDTFRSQSIGAYTELFEHLDCPDTQRVNGQFQAEFIGPGWLRWLAPKLLPLGGLPGWFGKCFKEDQSAINLLQTKQGLVESVPMVRREALSIHDQKPVLSLSYDSRAPLPLRPLLDEIRELDENTLLGLTVANLPILKRFPMPFLLRRI